jgi:serine/threonine-protein kinase HipA
MRFLDTWIGDKHVGRFSEAPQADGTFTYSFDYIELTDKNIVSLTMVPVAGELHFESRVFPSPFDMILPEGDRRLRIEEARKILRTDSFSMLAFVGANPVNRVRFLGTGEKPSEDPARLPTPKEIAGSHEGRTLFKALLEATDLRQGVAGVQPKILGAPALKLSDEPRQFRGATHLLKSSTDKFPFLAANEQACLDTFARAGVRVPKTTLSGDGELLLVERFDLRSDGSLLGFEEAAALMGETASSKYQRDYGTMFETLCDFISPLEQRAARLTLAKCLVLNHLLGNGDAHLKNFGVIYEDATHVSLAPAYDCVSTIPYIPADIPALALSFEWLSKAWWPRARIEEFSLQYGALNHAETRRMLEECCEAVLHGAKNILAMGQRIRGFMPLAKRMSDLWISRVSSFRAEASVLKSSRRTTPARN